MGRRRNRRVDDRGTSLAISVQLDVELARFDEMIRCLEVLEYELRPSTQIEEGEGTDMKKVGTTVYCTL